MADLRLVATIGDVVVSPDGVGFAALTMFQVIEHLDSPQRAFRRARALLRFGGGADDRDAEH